MLRLGLYGGSFDPVHRGHLLVAHAALEELGLDRLHLIPATQSPFKPESQPAGAALRLRMLRLAFAGQTRMVVDAREIQRGGVSYSIDTVRTFQSEFPGADLFWLIGADHVAALPRWRDAEDLARRVEFVVIPRPGTDAPPPPSLPAPFRLRHLRGFPLALSSSEIRDRVRRDLPIRHLVPAAVAELITAEGLYRDGTPGR